MRIPVLAICLFGVLAITGCATFAPKPLEEVPFMERVQTQEREGLRVSVSVLTREETKQAFGVDLEEKGIQPVWIRIENNTDEFFRFLLHGLDPSYYSAREAAYLSHLTWGGHKNDEMDQHFDKLAIDPLVDPHDSTAGFAFSNLKKGTKEVRVRIFGPGTVKDYHFYMTVPGLQADWQRVDFNSLYSEQGIVNIEDEEALREALDQLPITTTREDGTGQGDPLNLIIIAENLYPFIKAGWDETEVLTKGSAWRTVKSFFGGKYKYAPMSALYVYGRAQDVGFQKARDSIHERNHLRLWWTPIRFRGKKVWVGAISRDIGVYFTTRAWNLMTHAIDPNVDEAMHYLAEDLATAQSLKKFGYLGGVGPATQDNPHRNLMNAPYWTRGLRVVMLLSNDPVSLENISFFDWEWARDRSSREKTPREKTATQPSISTPRSLSK